MTDPDTTRSGAIVTAFFDRREEALRAMDRLAAIGLREDSLRLTAGEDPEGTEGGSTSRESHGFLDALRDFFFPQDDHDAYAEGLSRGGYLLTVRDVPSEMYDTTVDLLDDEGAVDIDERSSQWRSEGWQGGVASAGLGTGTIAGMGGTGADVEPGTSGMAGMDTPHAGVTADRDAEMRAETGESRGMITGADRRGDLWQRDMARGRPKVRTYMAVPPLLAGEDDPDAVERNNLPS